MKTEARGRTVDEWKLRLAGSDNHWLNCLVGCAVAASIGGAALECAGPAERPRREPVSFSELQRQAQRARGW